MLYARCSFCGYTAALSCSGQFMPHPTMPVSQTAMGPACPACGPMPQYFTCPFGHTQYLYLPGVSPMPQPGYAYAPVVQAQPGASAGSLAKAFVQAVGKAVGEGANEAMFGGGQSW